MKLTGAEIVCETLTALGTKTVFGYPGGAILPIYDALGKSKLHHVLVRHEQGATHMADGYARASGGVGVAMATSGPGASARTRFRKSTSPVSRCRLRSTTWS
jgi:acetolactate synthase-1/2/3 large subunit